MKDDAEVQLAVELYGLCKEFRCLPREGGILDQDSYYVTLISAAAAAFHEKQNKELKSAVAKHKGS